MRRAAIIANVVVLATCSGGAAPPPAPPVAPSPITASADAGLVDAAEPEPTPLVREEDDTVENEDIDFLLDGFDPKKGGIRASGDKWKPEPPRAPCIDPLTGRPHPCLMAPLKAGQRINRVPVPPAPTGRPRCGGVSPAPICERSSAETSADQDALVACANDLLAGRDLGRPDGNAIALTAAGAARVASSATARTLDEIALERSADLTALAGAAATIEVATMDPTDARRVAGLQACRRLVADLAATAPSEQLAGDLTCLARTAAGLDTHDVTTTWAGCRCGARGADRSGSCLEAISISRPFPEVPADDRLGDALEEALRRTNTRLSGYGMKITGLGLVGCHLARLERGGELADLTASASPRFRFAHLSEHLLGSACDIHYAWVKQGSELRGFAVEMLFYALLAPGNSTVGPSSANLKRWREKIRAAGEAAYWASVPYGISDKTIDSYTFSILVGVALRDGLVDAGFVVYAPTTNAAHWNHFHVHLPPEETIWTETSNDETTHARREELIAPALTRAAGLGYDGP
jgi:hypothetical protein